MQRDELFAALDYAITGGSEYGWSCYPNARYVDFESNPLVDVSAVICTDRSTIYEVTVCQKKGDTCYRWMNPAYRKEHDDEASVRNVSPNTAYDDVNWIDLETPEDFLTKMSAMLAGEEFDSRIEVPIELSDAEFTALARMAHERDITFNEMVVEILKEMVSRANE